MCLFDSRKKNLAAAAEDLKANNETRKVCDSFIVLIQLNLITFPHISKIYRDQMKIKMKPSFFPVHAYARDSTAHAISDTVPFPLLIDIQSRVFLPAFIA